MIPPKDCGAYMGHFRSEEAVAVTDSGRRGRSCLTLCNFIDAGFNDGPLAAEGPKDFYMRASTDDPSLAY